MGRIGTGEFAVLLADRQGLDLEGTVEDLIAELSRPYQLPNHLQTVSVSVGIVAMPKDGTDAARLLRRSNLALQQARATGLGSWSAFHPDMGRAADHRQWIEAELHTAFERGDFSLCYQPQLDLGSGRIVGYESLIRWTHPRAAPFRGPSSSRSRRKRAGSRRSANGSCARRARTPACCRPTARSPSTSRPSSS